MEKKKKRVLVVASDFKGGVGFYRSFNPHEYLQLNHSDEYEVLYATNVDWSKLEALETYDIIHVHKGIYKDMDVFHKALEHLHNTKTVTIMDIDDSWDLGESHPQYQTQKCYHTDDIIKDNLTRFDYITTTTPIFAEEIYKYNKHVKVIPNAINPEDSRFKIEKKTSDKIRVGFVMGAQHYSDVLTMENFVSKLPDDVIDKIEINLCGFDLRGVIKNINPKTKEVTERQMNPIETVWYKYEKILTNREGIVSEKYQKFLNMFIPDLEYPHMENEHYRRGWTKNINEYFKHYENVDILLAPLEVKMFNKVKSQLKAIECCFSDTALIATNYGPYTIDLKTAIDEEGNVIKDGNALLVDTDKNATDWAKYITLLVRNPKLIEMLKKNINKSLKDKYSLQAVDKIRYDFYNEITKYSN